MSVFTRLKTSRRCSSGRSSRTKTTSRCSKTEPKFKLDEAIAQNTSPAAAGPPVKPRKMQPSRRAAAALAAGERAERGLQVIAWWKFNGCFTGFFSHCDIQSGGGWQIFKKYFPEIYDIGGIFCALECDLTSGWQGPARGIPKLHDCRAPQAG